MFQLSDHYLCTGGELSSSARAIHPGETPTRKRLCGATSRPRDRPVKLPLNSIMMKRGSFYATGPDLVQQRRAGMRDPSLSRAGPASHPG